MNIFKSWLSIIILMALLTLIGIAFVSASNNECEISTVIDGDTFISNKGEHIRLSGIDCPEKGQPYGDEARNFSYGFVSNETMNIYRVGKDKYGRTIANLENQHRIRLAELLVSNGLAWVYKKYDSEKLYNLMLQARASKIGLWSQYSQPPFKYRKDAQEIYNK